MVMRSIHPAPAGMKRCGRYSLIMRPRRIDGSRAISIGERTLVSKYSWLSTIDKHASESFQPELIIGNDVYIGQYCCIVSSRKVVIEDGCVLSEKVYISDTAHGLDPEMGLIMQQKLVRKGGVHLGKSTFIGYGACVMPGVTLGEHCVVGANSVVTRSFPAFSMLVGVPARLIKTYCPDRKEWVSVEEKAAKH